MTAVRTLFLTTSQSNFRAYSLKISWVHVIGCW